MLWRPRKPVEYPDDRRTRWEKHPSYGEILDKVRELTENNELRRESESALPRGPPPSSIRDARRLLGRGGPHLKAGGTHGIHLPSQRG